MHSENTRNKTCKYGKWLAILTVLFFVSCSSPEKRFKVLSFFFDGVPDPKLKAAAELRPQPGAGIKKSAAREQQKFKVIKSSHPDYAKKNCSKCHDNSRSNLLQTRRIGVCFSCHSPEKLKKFGEKYLHGPVAVSACLACHTPHESIHDNLLVSGGNELCFNCHLEHTISRKPVHIDKTDPEKLSKTLCTSCHLPHSADNKMFLRPETSPDPKKGQPLQPKAAEQGKKTDQTGIQKPSQKSITLSLRSSDYPDRTRIVLQGSETFAYSHAVRESKVEIRLKNIMIFGKISTAANNSKFVAGIDVSTGEQGTVVVIHMKHHIKIKDQFILSKPFRVVFDLAKRDENK